MTWAKRWTPPKSCRIQTKTKSGVWFMRGAMYERMKKLDQAEVEFRKVLKANPG